MTVPFDLLVKVASEHRLKSSNIHSVDYDRENETLKVKFHSGGTYTYKDVPKSLFDRIKRVKSPGKFFHKHIKKDNTYAYEKLEKESEYKWYKSKDLSQRLVAGRPYPFSYLTGEAKELVEAIKNRDWENFKEEIGDTTFGAQMLLSQLTKLNHPVYADLSKAWKREKVWKDMFEEKGGKYHPNHMQGGSNFAKPSKIIKAFASAGIKINQREAERLADKYTGGKMEKEAYDLKVPADVSSMEHAPRDYSASNIDILGNLLLGKNYIPLPRQGEDISDAFRRMENFRNAAEIQGNMLSHNPVLERLGADPEKVKHIGKIMSTLGVGIPKPLHPVLGGDVGKASRDIAEMQSNPSAMSQFKEAAEIPEKVRAAILAGEKKLLKEFGRRGGISAAANKGKNHFKKWLDMGEEIVHPASDYTKQPNLPGM